MTINEVIAFVDEMKPNTFTDENKTYWLSELDGKITREVLKRNDAVKYSWPKDGEKTLLVSHPHDDIYSMYLFAMIDFANGDYEEYENAMNMFNQKYDIYARDYIRNNVPLSPGGFKNLW